MTAQKTKGPCVRLQAYIRPEEVADQLKAISYLEGIPVAELINEAVGKLVKQRAKKYGKTLDAIVKAKKHS